jgi:hypothetical protein
MTENSPQNPSPWKTEFEVKPLPEQPSIPVGKCFTGQGGREGSVANIPQLDPAPFDHSGQGYIVHHITRPHLFYLKGLEGFSLDRCGSAPGLIQPSDPFGQAQDLYADRVT